VLVSSHLLAEVEQICSHVGVMSRGSLVAQGTLAEFRAESGQHVQVDTPDVDDTVAVLADLGLTQIVPTIEGDGPAVRAVLGDQEPERVVAALVAREVRVRGFAVSHVSLEDRFVSLTGEGFDVAG
jgi:ABC-2 type transport system ATP-binding protein